MARGEAVQAVDALTGAPLTIPARAYSHGTLNRAWRTATGRVVGSNNQPDLLFVGEDSKIHAIEVVSASQDTPAGRQQLYDELEAVMNAIPDQSL